MAGRVPAVEDAEIITKRIAELQAERTANLNCRCHRPDGGGVVDSSQCPVHKPGAAPVAAVAMRVEHFPEDDWQRARFEAELLRAMLRPYRPWSKNGAILLPEDRAA